MIILNVKFIFLVFLYGKQHLKFNAIKKKLAQKFGLIRKLFGVKGFDW
jgi:hypothetical protein